MTTVVRLMWKEYRVLRSFWLALAIFGLVCDGAVFLSVDKPQERLPGLFAFAGVLPAGFALGAGAILFALEREESTREFLRSVPITSLRVFTSKVVTAVAATLLLALLLLAVTLEDVRDMAVRPIVDRGLFIGAVDLTLVYTIMVLQAMGWSVFFSLRSARPLLAALLGALGALSCIGLVHAANEHFGLLENRPRAAPMSHLAATVAIWAVDAWLGSRWLHGRRVVEIARFHEITRFSALGRLLWQQWRRSYHVLAGLVLLGLLVPGLIWPAFIPTTGLVFALFGSCTFLADQEGRQFRFFAERGVPARRVWLSRQLFWAGAALLLALVLFLAHRLAMKFFIALVPEDDGRYLWDRLRWVFDPAGYAIWIGLAYGAGQLASMFFRSGVLAAAMGVALAVLFLSWAVLMHALGIGLWWSVVPLPLALFAATWLRTSGWILERNTARAWWPPLVVLAVPVLSILAAVPAYRVWEIPDPEVALTIAAPAPSSAAAKKAAHEFLLACLRLPLRPEHYNLAPLDDPGNAEPTAAERQWLQQNEAALNESLDALASLPADATIRAGTTVVYLRSLEMAINWRQLAALIIRSGQIAERGGEPDDAWRRYQVVLQLAGFLRRGNGAVGEVIGGDLERVALTQLPRWGAREGQTLERLQIALDEVRQLERHDEPLADVVRRDYQDNLDVLNEVQSHPDDWGRQAVLMARYAPWEFTRVRRLLEYKASVRLQDAQRLDMGVSASASGELLVQRPGEFEMNRLSSTTMPYHDLPDLTTYRRSALCYRRGTQLALAAEAYRFEQGQLPKDLSNLQGKYFEKLPVEPCHNSQFDWFPWGLRLTVRSWNVAKIPAGTPFVYTAGPRMIDNESRQNLLRLRRESADDRIIRSDAALAPAGLGAPAGAAAGPPAPSGMGMPAPGAPPRYTH